MSAWKMAPRRLSKSGCAWTVAYYAVVAITVLGRSRWMPDGKAIAFVGLDDAGLTGVFVQDFVPGRDTTATRRKLAGFDPDYITETFAISPHDGALG